jgi:hypothetical protein
MLEEWEHSANVIIEHFRRVYGDMYVFTLWNVSPESIEHDIRASLDDQTGQYMQEIFKLPVAFGTLPPMRSRVEGGSLCAQIIEQFVHSRRQN